MLYRTTIYAYNPQNRLTSMAEWDGVELPTQEQIEQKKISYTYDTEGKVTGVDYAFAKDGITGLTYAYDDFGRVAEMKDYYGFAEGGSDHILREYIYDDFGRVTKMTYTDSKDGEMKESYGYAYDKNSNILQERIISHYTAADGKALDCTKNYTYDKNGRLTRAEVIDHTEGAAGRGTTEYTYDPVGNRTQKTAPEGTTDYRYNGLNQLTSAKTTKPGDTGEMKVLSELTNTYDRNGNQTKEINSVNGEAISMTYDAANRLTGYEKKKDGSVVLNQQNQYNGEGRRIRKEETKGAESGVRNYYYQDSNVLYTTDGENQRDSFNLQEPEDNVIATSRGTGSSEAWYLYNKDTRRSTSSLIDNGGMVAAAYEYNEFGNTTVRAGEDFDNEICYTGQVYDKETGLYYYNARFYNPEDGRFLTQDTYRGEQMEPDTLHLYAYCTNKPVNYVDPSGHRKFNVTKGTEYAREYAAHRNSQYKSFTYDCTNFASQILYNGGVNMNNTWWYSRVAKTWSKTWTVADKFVKFWGTYKIFKRKRNQKYTQIYRLTKAVKKGDFIAYDRTGDGKWDHVAYVTGKSGKKKTIQQRRVYNIQIAQHTRDYCSWLTNVGEEGRKNGWVPHYKKNYKKIRYTILKRI